MIIEEGKENEFIEFKESLSQLEKGLCALTAMLNKHGKGTVYFGVDDKGSVINKITIGKDTLNDIRNKIKDLIKPALQYDLEIKNYKEGNIIKLSAYGLDKPYSFDGRYYIRNASCNEQLDPILLRRLFLDESVDLIKQIPSDLQELTFSDMLLILSTHGIHVKNDINFYSSIGLYNSKEQFNYMAFLLSDQNNLSIKITTFAGTNKEHMIERKEFTSHCLLKTINDTLTYMSLKNETKVDLSKGVRVEKELFDFESFREAWINACLHNSWAHMVPPSIFIFDDRIEIVSYGQLPYSLSLEKFYEGESKPINKALFNIFIMANLAEQSGHGVPIIVKHYSEKAFSFVDEMIKVTLKFKYTPTSVSVRKEHEEMDLTENQQNVLNYLIHNPKAKIEEVSKENNLSVPGVKKIIATLKENKFIERVGNKRDSVWKKIY